MVHLPTRAIEQYKVTGYKSHINLIKTYVMIKRAAALTNFELQVLDERIAKVIIKLLMKFYQDNSWINLL